MKGGVTGVVPQRGWGELTLDCLISLRRVEPALGEIVVVDDGREDGAAELVEGAGISGVRVVRQPARGVTAAWNAGIRIAETELVLLLNNDVEATGPFLNRLIEPLRLERRQVVGAEWREEPLIPEGIRSRIDGGRLLSGWCLGFARATWEALGGFDERMELYFSDTDFQCRVVEACTANRPALCVPASLPLRHLGHRTTRGDPERSRKWGKDRGVFLRKWEERVEDKG